jgi:hypothetical protein
MTPLLMTVSVPPLPVTPLALAVAVTAPVAVTEMSSFPAVPVTGPLGPVIVMVAAEAGSRDPANMAARRTTLARTRERPSLVDIIRPPRETLVRSVKYWKPYPASLGYTR